MSFKYSFDFWLSPDCPDRIDCRPQGEACKIQVSLHPWTVDSWTRGMRRFLWVAPQTERAAAQLRTNVGLYKYSEVRRKNQGYYLAYWQPHN